MSDVITLTGLLAEIGDDHLTMQPLNPAVTNMAKRKEYNEVSFATEVSFGLDGPSKTGLVVWVENEVFDAAVKRLRAEKGAGHE